jgi:DNA-binding IclR family transcriptional regulator
MLAFLPEGDRRALLDATDLQAHTPSTCTGREALLRRLQNVRAEGAAVVDGEYNAELLCVAAPVLGRDGRPEAALTVAMPSAEADEERVETVRNEVREQALALSRRMGYLAGREALSGHEAPPGREAPA